MKKFIIVIISIMMFSQLLADVGDVRLKIPASSLNNGFQALVDARALSTSAYAPGWGVDNWVVNITSLSISLQPPDKLTIIASVSAMANINLAIFDFDIGGKGTVDISCLIEPTPEGDGYIIEAKPTSITITDFGNLPGFFLHYASDLINGYIIDLPIIPVASFTYALPEVSPEYFTPPTPDISLTSTDIIISLAVNHVALDLQNITIQVGESATYEATQSISAAGNGTYFIIEGDGTTGGDVTFAAGEIIYLKPGFTAEKGSKLSAHIQP